MKPDSRGPLSVTIPFSEKRTALGELETDSRLLAEATGFPQAEVVGYILTGEQPSLQSVNVRRTYLRLGGGQVQEDKRYPVRQKSTIVEIFSPDLTLLQLRKVHRLVRAGMNVKRVKALTAKHEKFLELVGRQKRQAGGKIGPTAKAFWHGVREEWNRIHPNEQYLTYRGPERLYRRLMKRLKRPEEQF